MADWTALPDGVVRTLADDHLGARDILALTSANTRSRAMTTRSSTLASAVRQGSRATLVASTRWKLHAIIRRGKPACGDCVRAQCRRKRHNVNIIDPFFNRPRFVQYSPYCSRCANRYVTRGVRIANSHMVIA